VDLFSAFTLATAQMDIKAHSTLPKLFAKHDAVMLWERAPYSGHNSECTRRHSKSHAPKNVMY